MKIKIAILFLSIMILIGCQPKYLSKTHLKERVSEYYSLLSKGKYDLTWDYLCQKAKRRRDREEWSKFVLEIEVEEKLVEFHIVSMKFVQPFIGKIRILIKNKKFKQNIIEDFEGDEDWVYENGDWFKYVD